MSDVPMPRDLSEESVAEWLDDRDDHGDRSVRLYIPLARAVRALVSAKVREAVTATAFAIGLKSGETTDAIVSRVLGDHPSNASGGHEAEGREAPRG